MAGDDQEARQGSVIAYCAHDMSLTGAEGPALYLGRPVILWECDMCGATVLDG